VPAFLPIKLSAIICFARIASRTPRKKEGRMGGRYAIPANLAYFLPYLYVIIKFIFKKF
jgi:hypothetical protein